MIGFPQTKATLFIFNNTQKGVINTSAFVRVYGVILANGFIDVVWDKTM